MNNLRLSDARVRITSTKVELIATEIATMYPEDDQHGQDLTDRAIEILYGRTRALRQVGGIDREVYVKIKAFVDNFNITQFMCENGLEYF